MSQGDSGGSDGRAIRRTAAFRVADALALAASPTFAIMALLTGVMGGGPVEMAGMNAPVSPMSGMVTMYVLMSAFHTTAWLKLIRGNGRAARRMPESSTTSAPSHSLRAKTIDPWPSIFFLHRQSCFGGQLSSMTECVPSDQ